MDFIRIGFEDRTVVFACVLPIIWHLMTQAVVSPTEHCRKMFVVNRIFLVIVWPDVLFYMEWE